MLLDEKKNDLFSYDDDDLDDLSTYSSIDEILEEKEHSDTKPQKKKFSIVKEILSYVQIVCIAAIAALLINYFVIVNASIPSGSMNNTIMEGDHLIGFRLAYTFSGPERGDIIIFNYPDDPSQKFVKRVIGLPGDIVEIKTEYSENVPVTSVYVNGQKLNEPYLKEPMALLSENSVFIVPADSYFVLGDNRNDSKDSRYWQNTYVPKEYILAKAIFKYYSEFEILTSPEYE